MGSLLLAVMANTIMIFSMKFSEAADTHRQSVVFLNYVFGTVMAIFLCRDLGSMNLCSQETLIPLGLGLFNAILMAACMLIQQHSINFNGAGLTTTYNRLGVLIPTLLSVFLFQEYPTALKICGIGLSVTAIGYSYEKTGEAKKNYVLLSLVLIIGGMIDFNSKLLGILSPVEMKSVYTISTFFIAAILMAAIVICGKIPINRKDMKYGALIGIPNICITFGMVSASANLPAYIVFPAYSGGVILLVNIIDELYLKERLSKRERIATAMIAFSLVLINL